MKEILIGTKNDFKKGKLVEIVGDYFSPVIHDQLEEVEELGDNFLEIARNKAIAYSKNYGCLVISTDAGTVIPSLAEWEPVKTRRFGNTDMERIAKLLEMMKGKKDRTLQWYEALAMADSGKLLFSAQERAMDCVIDEVFNPKYYREGIWLCSISSFPQFDNKNFFELTDEEREKAENSWGKLKKDFKQFMQINTA